MSLQRFHEAQASRSASYNSALAEMSGERTRPRVLANAPRVRELEDRFGGAPKTARKARALPSDSPPLRLPPIPRSAFYIPSDPLLRARYEEITAAVSDQLARGLALEDLIGSRIDALKLVSRLLAFAVDAQPDVAGRLSKNR